ncbi:putative LRR receptor-like serine/threonine-protein kinase [Prunus yedoensis var. nudiflora]|uniref:Putative LRR receptor-like serine/threonine-protein kinase n=1 Tax=Prunus yedoensis var. nudiflora TaxID=2094558 RepID=A0A314Y899_PRUYE|nr:putative LRR receptor-like serine/threonine-protein kinase [Prunus yedoensis var. nudiflora]
MEGNRWMGVVDYCHWSFSFPFNFLKVITDSSAGSMVDFACEVEITEYVFHPPSFLLNFLCRSASTTQGDFNGEQFKIALDTSDSSFAGNSLFCQAERVLVRSNIEGFETRKIWKHQWKDHGKFCDLLAEDYFNLAFKFYEDVNVTKMLEDAGISVGMDFDPNLIIQVIRKKTNSFANIKCYNGMLWEVRICFEKDGMFRDCNMRPQDMFQNCKRKINTYDKISLPTPPTIKAQIFHFKFVSYVCTCRPDEIKLGCSGLLRVAGEIPDEIGDPHNLQDSLPTDIGTGVPDLQQLLVGDNKLGGTIPCFISNGSNKLTRLDITANSFFGFIPTTLCAFTNLQWLNLQWNNLTVDASIPLGSELQHEGMLSISGDVYSHSTHYTIKGHKSGSSVNAQGHSKDG